MVAPSISDVPRRSEYAPVASVGPFAVGFPIFDASGDDLRVTLDGDAVTNWTLLADQEAGFYGAPNTYVNGEITFLSPITGALVIEGRRSPRRQSQFAEGRGVPARDLNAEFNILTAMAREMFDRLGVYEATIITEAVIQALLDEAQATSKRRGSGPSSRSAFKSATTRPGAPRCTGQLSLNRARLMPPQTPRWSACSSTTSARCPKAFPAKKIGEPSDGP